MLIPTHPVNSGLGLLEYLQFIEDAGMESIMAVWSGEYILRSGASNFDLIVILKLGSRLRARRH